MGGPRKLGIQYQELGEQLAQYFKLGDDRGVLVSHVEADGPAAKAGLKAGDVILKLAGRSVRDGDDLRHELERAEPGSEVALSVHRDGRALELKVTLGGARIVNCDVNAATGRLSVLSSAPAAIRKVCTPAAIPAGSVNDSVSASTTLTAVAGTLSSVRSLAATELARTGRLKLTVAVVGATSNFAPGAGVLLTTPNCANFSLNRTAVRAYPFVSFATPAARPIATARS